MSNVPYDIAFGPVPSRRLGQSMGINNVPPRHCSLACVYCQLGCTTHMRVTRRPWLTPEALVAAVERRLRDAQAAGERIDYLTFVADGEPTLDSNLGREIELLAPLGVKTAVITNATLLWRGDVREELLQADWVSVKVDAARERAWRRVNRPHGSLDLARLQEGISAFCAQYHSARGSAGRLVTETMLVRGVNDSEPEIEATAAFVGKLQPDCAYLAVPIRPPAERWVKPADKRAIDQAYMVFASQCASVELLVEHEQGAFASTGCLTDDLLAILAVHPMREEAVGELLRRAGTDWAVVPALEARGMLIRRDYNGTTFYLRRVSE